jgi:hypothetical protein
MAIGWPKAKISTDIWRYGDDKSAGNGEYSR